MRGSQALLFTLVMVTLSHLGDTTGECKAEDGECAAKPISAICDEDYAVKAKVLEDDLAMVAGVQYRRYKINVLAYYKWDDCVNPGYVYTSMTSEECGVTFDLNQDYLFMGWVDGYKLWTKTCSYVEKWSELTTREKRKMTRGKYIAACSCP